MKPKTVHNEKPLDTTKKAMDFDEDQGLTRPTVLVAGGASFVGSYLCEFLLLRECRVIALDNLLTGRKENLQRCFDDPLFNFEQRALDQSLDDLGKINYIFHLAGLESFRDQKKNLAIAKTKTQGTSNLLKLAKENKARFLLTSLIDPDDKNFSHKDFDQILENPDPSLSFANLVGAGEFAEKLTKDYSLKEGVDARVVRLGFVYGPRMSLEGKSLLTRLVRATVKGGSLKIPGDGAEKVYPTFVSDVVYALSRAMFSLNTKGQTFDLVDPEGISLLELAHLLKKISNQDLEVVFVSQEKRTSFLLSKGIKEDQSKLSWRPKIELKEGLGQTLAFFERRKANLISENKKKPLVKKGRLKAIQKKRFLASLLLILGLILSPLALVGLDGLWALFNLKQAQMAVEKGKFLSAAQKAHFVEGSLARIQSEVLFFSPLFDLFGQESSFSRIEKLFSVSQKMSRSFVLAGEALESASFLGNYILDSGGAAASEEGIYTRLEQIQLNLSLVYEELSWAQAELKTKEDLLPFEVPFEKIRHLVLDAKEGLEILPGVIGLEGRRVYLVLLQNNMELRPTGGFIGSFGLLTLNKGQLVDFEVQDVYAADGQLKGHVEPPLPIKNYLGEAGWYLRDSNWHPDFPISALRAEWFLEKELGRTVDGVIGINLNLAQAILAEIGEIQLPDFQEKINEKNLFERAEYHSEVGFFPGSTQKKDFLGTLTRVLFEKIKNASPEVQAMMGKVAYQSLLSKDTLVYLKEPQEMKTVSDLGWDGSLREIECQPVQEGADCLVDYLMIVEANLGVNKANYFVERKVQHETQISSRGEIREKLTITYLNQSPSDKFPAGNYKNYLRLLVPEKASLVSLAFDGKRQNLEKVDQEKTKGKGSFGFLVEVPIKGEKTVEVVYRLPKRLDLSLPARYLLLIQKQPGAEDENFSFSLNAPSGFSLIEARPLAKTQLNQASFSLPLNQDLVLEAVILR